MSIVTTRKQAWAVETEDTEGTYKAPTSSASFVQTLSDGAEMSRSKETIERNVFTNSIGKTSPRTGQFQVTGTLPVELRSSSVEGDAPEFDKLITSALGTKRQITSETTSDDLAHTTSMIYITDADQTFQVDDIIMVKEANGYHVSPLSDVTSTYIELEIPMDSAPANQVAISKSTIYTVADSGHPSLSISRYLEDAVLQQAVGCKVNSMSMEGFSTGQIPSLSFGFEGLNFDSSLTAPPYSASYDDKLPPIILDAKVYMDGSIIDVNELSFSIENTLGFQTSVNEANGRKSSRVTERTITGSFNPYMRSDSMANFTKFKNNTPFSIFAIAKLPSSTSGEYDGVVAIWIKNCVISELGENDADGLLQDNISFSANRGSTGTIDEIYMAFI